MGTSPLILEVRPGLVNAGRLPTPPEDRPESPLEDLLELPPVDQRGVLFEMASRGIPVLHLLHVRGLAVRYGLPWDPIPLPGAGTTRLRDAQAGNGAVFWIITFLYLGAMVLVFPGWRRLLSWKKGFSRR
jgi:hypothetical protein